MPFDAKNQIEEMFLYIFSPFVSATLKKKTGWHNIYLAAWAWIDIFDEDNSAFYGVNIHVGFWRGIFIVEW